MGYLLLMTSAGSALHIGYLCWAKILGKSMTQRMRYRALTLVMLIYVVSWAWLGGVYRWAIGFFWTKEVVAGAKGLIDVADIEAKEMAYRTKEYRLLMLAMLIWFMIAALLLLIRTVKFLKMRYEFHTLAIKCEDENLEPALERLRETVRFRNRARIVWTRVDNGTFTLGAVKPVIFLQKKYAEGDLYWILKHEIMHIVGMDIWVKLLLEFVCCLHWFNPLIYFLKHEIKYLSETSCDERVLNGCTEAEREVYIDLLERNRGDSRQKTPCGSALKGNTEIDRRIALMKETREIGGKEKAVAIGVFAFLVFLNSLTALAYPKVRHVKDAVIETAEDAVDGNNFWIYDYNVEGYDIYQDLVLYDEQFVDEDGEIYPIDFTAEEGCLKHNIILGIVQVHGRDGEGGCTLEVYDGTRCTECGTVWKGDLLHKTRKMPCSH